MCVLRTLKICSLTKFQVPYTVVLSIVTELFISSPELIHHIIEYLYLLIDIIQFSYLHFETTVSLSSPVGLTI